MFVELSYKKVNKVYMSLKDKKIITKNAEVKEVEIKEEIKPKEYIETKDNEESQETWQIEIPKIDLVAPIANGTSQDTMLEYVGHFENTQKWEGNVGLAAHNRGFPINYFAKLKELNVNDEIIYKTSYGIKKYKVSLITIIEDTDWSYLQETKENKITLITCVENKPNNRRCVQGIEIEEE